MASLPTLPTSPAAGDTGTASWADNTAAWVAFLAAPPTFVGTGPSFNPLTSTATVIPIDTEEIDSAGGHDNVTNNSRYTAQYAGRYWVVATAIWPSTANGRRSTQLLKNGATTYNDANITIPATTGAAGVLRTQAARMIFLAVNDYVEGQAFQDSGGTINGVTGSLQVLWTGSS
jgi:hypothetical protein